MSAETWYARRIASTLCWARAILGGMGVKGAHGGPNAHVSPPPWLRRLRQLRSHPLHCSRPDADRVAPRRGCRAPSPARGGITASTCSPTRGPTRAGGAPARTRTCGSERPELTCYSRRDAAQPRTPRSPPCWRSTASAGPASMSRTWGRRWWRCDAAVRPGSRSGCRRRRRNGGG
jgi:hypothetical protein